MAEKKTEAVADTDAQEGGRLSIEEEEEEGSPVAEWGDWEEWNNEDGISYFYNKKTEESVWTDPRTKDEKDAMLKTRKSIVRPPAFLPKEAWEAAIAAASRKKDAPTKDKDVLVVFKQIETPRKPQFQQAISTIREELETMRSRGTSRVGSDGKVRSRGESEWTEADSDSELDEDEKTKRMRALLRLDSEKSWDKEDLADLHDEMHQQLEQLTSQARQSGMALPTLHKRAPRRPPPALPPPSLKNVPSPADGTEEDNDEDEKMAMPRDSNNTLGSTNSLLARPPRPFSASPNLGLTGSRASSTRSISSVSSLATAPGGENVKRQASLFLNNAPYLVIADWVPDPKSKTKIAISKGDPVLIQKQGSSGWWLGKNLRTNQSGYFPGSYCEKSEQSLPPMGRATTAPTQTNGAPPRPARAAPTAGGSIWKAKLMHNRAKAQKKKAKQQTNAYSYNPHLDAD